MLELSSNGPEELGPYTHYQWSLGEAALCRWVKPWSCWQPELLFHARANVSSLKEDLGSGIPYPSHRSKNIIKEISLSVHLSLIQSYTSMNWWHILGSESKYQTTVAPPHSTHQNQHQPQKVHLALPVWATSVSALMEQNVPFAIVMVNFFKSSVLGKEFVMGGEKEKFREMSLYKDW